MVIENIFFFLKNGHWHINNSQDGNNELIYIVTSIITNKSRYKEVKRDGKVIDYMHDFKNENDEWVNLLETGTINLKFWVKPDFEYRIINFM